MLVAQGAYHSLLERLAIQASSQESFAGYYLHLQVPVSYTAEEVAAAGVVDIAAFAARSSPPAGQAEQGVA